MQEKKEFLIHRSSHLDFIPCLVLFCVGVLLRGPFMGKILYHWDSINFAYSLQQFDVAKGQPHVPGYILYVFLARLVNLIFNDAQLTLVTISVISTGLAIAWLYLLGSIMFNRAIGLLAALFLASSPLFWFYGEIALPHTLDTFSVILIAWFLYQIMQGGDRFVIPLAIWLALAGGMRPQTEVFLAPLTLYALMVYLLESRSGDAVWQGLNKTRLKTVIVALIIFLGVNLAWFVPLLWLSGGYSRYFQIMAQFSDEFQTTTSVFKEAGWVGLRRNIIKLTMYTLYAWGLPLIPVLVAGVKLLKSSSVQAISKLALRFQNLKRFWFLFCWIVPSFVYYLFIHMGQQGLVFVYLPALLLISAASVHYLAELTAFSTMSGLKKFAIVGLIIANGLIFVAMPTYPLGSDSFKLLTHDTLRLHDSSYLSRFEAVRQQLPPSHTFILASQWRFPQYYLPEYKLLPYKLISRWEIGEGQSSFKNTEIIDGAVVGLTTDNEGNFNVILFDDELLPFNRSPDHQQYLTLPNGEKLTYLRFTPQERFNINPQFYEVVMAGK